MIKNKELVFKMSAEERIRLIASTAFKESGSVENYQFPVFKILDNPSQICKDSFFTAFPSDKALLSTWNLPVIGLNYKCIGEEARANADYAVFNISNKDEVSEDYFLTGKFLSQKVKGVVSADAHINYEYALENYPEITIKEQITQMTDSVMCEAQPDSVLLFSADYAEQMSANYGYKGLLFGVASSKEEVAKYIYSGCSLVYLKGDFIEELIPYLVYLTEQYLKSEMQYKAGIINLAEFDRRQRCQEILDGNLIDCACDHIISHLLQLKALPADVKDRVILDIEYPHRPLFNERLHDDVALGASRQSIVLLKNEGKILPLDRNKKVAVIGEYAKNFDYQTDFNPVNHTAKRLAFELINDYEINAVGYAHGYLKGEKGRDDLIDTACKLCADVDCALLYLCAENGQKHLPEGQLEIIDALYGRGVKIIAVVIADGVIDMRFTEKCRAVLFNYGSGQNADKAVFDIISGGVCPSGKLVETFPVDLEKPCNEAGNIRYPFGFGLSYTAFEYRNLKVTNNGISCTVYNTGECDGYATIQLYVKKNGGTATSLSEKQLKGFEKVFIKKNDAVKVEIPFDKNTFRTYDFSSGKYRIEGGNYNILIGDSAETIRLNCELTLEEHVYDDCVIKQEKSEFGEPKGFTATKAEAVIRREKKGLSFGLKLFLALVLTIYVDAMCAVLAFTNLVTDKDFIFYIVIGAVCLIWDILAIIYIAVASKKRKLQRFIHPNDVLSDMVEKVGEFKEIAKVSFDEPVKEQVEEIAEEENAEESEEEEEQQPSYTASFAEEEEGETSFAENVSFAELCSNFRAYASSKGVSVEPSSVRALLAVTASNKLAVINCKNREILPEFLGVLGGYFGNTAITAEDGWNKSEDLLWVEDEENYVASDFTNIVHTACLNPEKMYAVVLDNVHFGKLKKYFSEFISYALCPSEKHTLYLTDELSLELPANICYFIVPAPEENEIPAEIIHASMLVDIIASKAGEVGEEVEIKQISRASFDDLVKESREKFFMSEKIWKKLDELTEAVIAKEKFSIGNKDLLQIEKFTSVLMDCGADETEALIVSFTAKIVHLLKMTKAYSAENGAKTLYGIIEKLFGEEDVTRIQKALLND